MTRQTLRWACAALLLAAAPMRAQVVYIAFGDSITWGTADDGRGEGEGYPARLEDLLSANSEEAIEVRNFGVPGENTVEGLNRINSTLAGGDILLLMEGTNDINAGISVETTIFNLQAMARKAKQMDVEPVHATLIPRSPQANKDSNNVLTRAIVVGTRETASKKRRQLVDPFAVFTRTPNFLQELYVVEGVGHPNGAGYDLLAQAFADVLLEVDTVAPVTGVSFPADGAEGVKRNTTVTVDLYDFGAGIDQTNTQFLVDDEPVEATISGNARKVEISYKPPSKFGGVVRTAIRTQDLAVPANTLERELTQFVIKGAKFVKGDINRDGRVDGKDLIFLGIAFGARKGDSTYFAGVDLNGDGRVDGDDLAVVAKNFGKQSS